MTEILEMGRNQAQNDGITASRVFSTAAHSNVRCNRLSYEKLECFRVCERRVGDLQGSAKFQYSVALQGGFVIRFGQPLDDNGGD